MNLAAFFTYNIIFPDLKLVSFLAYTYNIQGWCDGTMGSADDAGTRKKLRKISTYNLLIYQL